MQVLDGPKTTIYALAFSPDGDRLVRGGKDGGLEEIAFGREPETLSAGGHVVNAACYSPNGARLVQGGSLGWFGFRREDDGGWHPTGPSLATPTTAVGFLDNGTVAVGTGDRAKAAPGAFELWNLSLGYRSEPRFQEPAGVRAVATHPASRTVAWANGSRRVTAWDVLKPDPVHFTQPDTSPSLAFHPDGQLLAAATDRGFRVYDVAKRRERVSVRGHAGRVTSLAFSPDGRALATGSWDETVRLWDPATGRETACFRWPVGKVFCLAYAPDGLRLAAGGDRGTIVVWDVG